MFEKYIRFNLKLSPAYLVLAFIFIFGIVLTGDKETYVNDMASHPADHAAPVCS